MTSSVVAGALGHSPHMTPFQAWLSITGRSDFDGNKATERGTLLEDVVMSYPLERIEGLSFQPAPFRQLDSMPWAGDSADGVYMLDGEIYAMGEGKTVGLGGVDGYGDEMTDDVPMQHIIQSHWHLIHWPEAQRVLFPILVGGFAFEFRLHIIERDLDLESTLVDQAQEWHERYVLTDIPPPATAGDGPALLGRTPRAEIERLEATPAFEALVRAKAVTAKALKNAKFADDSTACRIKQLMGAAGLCMGKGWKATWKNDKDSIKTDWEAVARGEGALAELITKHTSTKVGNRPLKISVEA